MDEEEKAREATVKVNALLEELQEAIDKTLAEVSKICDEAQIDVYFAPTGYGSGQTYYPNDSSEYIDEYQGRWVSSSEEC